MPRASARYRLAAAAAGVLLAGSLLLVLHGALHPAAADRFVDTEVYQLGAHAVLHHHDPYVPVSTHGGAFTYPPLAAYLFTVLLPLGRTAAGTVLAVLTVLTAAAVIALCLSRAGGSSRAPRAGSRARAARAVLPWTLAVTAVCLPLQPLTNTVSFGQIGVLLAGLVTVDLLTSTRLPRGVLIGIAAAIKLTPALFLVHLWVSGQRRAAITGAATAAGITAAAAALFPAASRTYWTTALWQTGRVGASDGPRNRSLWGLTQRLLPDHTAALTVALATGALLTGWGLVRARRCHRRGDDVTALVVVGCLTCLDSPITWSHHLGWLVAALVLAVARRGRTLVLAPLLLWAVLPYPALFTDTVASQPNVQVLALIAAVLALPAQQARRRPATVAADGSPVTARLSGQTSSSAGRSSAAGVGCRPTDLAVPTPAGVLDPRSMSRQTRTDLGTLREWRS